ncbi:MAG TPA: hypothetical protein VGA22_08645 [Gemmatimonadales bacterium]
MILSEMLRRGEAMHEELGREWYRAGAGLTENPEFAAIYDRNADLQSDEALALARDSDDRALLEWIVDVRIGRRVAPFEERQMRWEQQAMVDGPSTAVPYLRVPIVIANTTDRSARLQLDRARVRVAAELVPLRRERLEQEHELLLSLVSADDYVSAFSTISGIDLDALGREARAFLEGTSAMYDDSLARLARRRLGVSLGQLERSDALWLFRVDRYDAGFPPAHMVAVASAQMAEMGLDATQGGRVVIDTAERERKQPRAFCVPVRVPDEVYLVLRPSGGHGDYRTFWHELGHAMHFAAVDPTLPFSARWLGDNSVTEGFAMLWDHLTISSHWLQRYTELSPADRADLVFELAVSELFMARRYAAKLNYELELHRSGVEGAEDRYDEWLSEATRFRYDGADALLDLDFGFYAARYLRAWQLEAALANMLVSRFDVQWFRRAEAGAVVLDLMRRGQASAADELADTATGQSLSFAPVVTRMEHVLD